MYYICVENKKVVSILEYEPNVPPTIKVYQISNSDYALIENKEKFFNATTGQVEDIPDSVKSTQLLEEENRRKRAYLNSSDWIVLRHLREKALGIQTSITETEYLNLEQDRQNIAKSL